MNQTIEVMRVLEAMERGERLAAEQLLHPLKKNADVSPARWKHKKYMTASSPIVDEFGY